MAESNAALKALGVDVISDVKAGTVVKSGRGRPPAPDVIALMTPVRESDEKGVAKAAVIKAANAEDLKAKKETLTSKLRSAGKLAGINVKTRFAPTPGSTTEGTLYFGSDAAIKKLTASSN